MSLVNNFCVHPTSGFCRDAVIWESVWDASEVQEARAGHQCESARIPVDAPLADQINILWAVPGCDV
jgi:hypothetical protein